MTIQAAGGQDPLQARTETLQRVNRLVHPHVGTSSEPSPVAKTETTVNPKDQLQVQKREQALQSPASLSFVDTATSPTQQEALNMIKHQNYVGVSPWGAEEGEKRIQKFESLLPQLSISELEELKGVLLRQKAAEELENADPLTMRVGAMSLNGAYLAAVEKALDKQTASAPFQKAQTVALEQNHVAVSPQGYKEGEQRVAQFKQYLTSLGPLELNQLKQKLLAEQAREEQENSADPLAQKTGSLSLTPEFLGAVQAELNAIRSRPALSQAYQLSEEHRYAAVSPQGFEQSKQWLKQFEAAVKQLNPQELARLKANLLHQQAVEKASEPDNPLYQKVGGMSLTAEYLALVTARLG